MKFISDRISFHRHAEYTTILISTKVEKWKESLLFGWMLMWSLIGVLIFYLLITGNYQIEEMTTTPKNQLQLFLIIFLIFWGYYLYRIIRVYWWRRKGVEYLKIDKDSLLIKRAFGKIGIARSYLYTNMGLIQLLMRPEKSFSKVMQSAFWDIGNESIEFEYEGKKIIFGIQLDSSESKKLSEFLKTEIKKRQKQKS